MPLAIPTRGLIQASAAQAIAFPTQARAQAVTAIADYLRMLRGWTETQFALAGNGASVVAVSNRNSYIYARLGSADGEVIEAKLINLLEPQNDDPLLVRLENPGGAGGWLVLDNLAQTQTLRTCIDLIGRLWLLATLDLFRIDEGAGFIGTRTTDDTTESYILRLGLPQDAAVIGDTTLYYSSDMIAFAEIVTAATYDDSSPNAVNSWTLDARLATRQQMYHVRYNKMTIPPDDVGIREAILDAVAATWGSPAPVGTYSTADLADNTNFYADGEGALKLDISTNGGASFTAYTLDYLGELLPWHLKPTTDAAGAVSYDDWYDEFGGCPCDNPLVIGPGEQRIVTWVLNEDGTAYDSIHVCDDCEDFPYVGAIETVWFPEPLTLGVAAKEDGNGAYVFLHARSADAQTTNGEYLSAFGWFAADPDDSFGNEQQNITLFVWEVGNGGSATRKTLTQGPFDATTMTLADYWQFHRAVVDPLDANNVYVAYTSENGSAEPTLGVQLLDFDAFTFTDLSAPFAPFDALTQGGTVPARGIVCTQSGALFALVQNSSTFDLIVWRYKAATWEDTDITTQAAGSNAILTYSWADDRLYLVFDDGQIGYSDDDGDTWTFDTVTYDETMGGVTAVDAY